MSALVLLLLAAPPATVSIEAGPTLAPDAPLVERAAAACREIDGMLGAPAAAQPPRVIVLEQAATTDVFVARAGRARFEGAALVGRTLWLQPALDRLGDVDAVLRHECVHAILRARGVPPLDPVDEEAVALTLAGQAARLPPAPPLADAERASVSQVLRKPPRRDAYERALARVASTYAARVAALVREGRLVEALRAKPDLR